MCRSRQLTEAFSLPPTNHFANGGSHSSACCHLSDQLSHSACRSQKPIRSIAASSYSSGFALASRARSSGGSNRRFSCNSASRAGCVDVTTLLLRNGRRAADGSGLRSRVGGVGARVGEREL